MQLICAIGKEEVLWDRRWKVDEVVAWLEAHGLSIGVVWRGSGGKAGITLCEVSRVKLCGKEAGERDIEEVGRSGSEVVIGYIERPRC